MGFDSWVENVGKVVDVVGIVVMVSGIVLAGAITLARRRRGSETDGYRLLRQRIGRAILLGLELLVAADIIRTVAVATTFESVGVLALVVLIRIVLSFALEVELEGRWPWERHALKSTS
jgi:uncharacterized membrane protein